MLIRTPNTVTKVQDGTHRTNKTTLAEGDLLTRQDKATLVIIVPSIKKQKCNFSATLVFKGDWWRAASDNKNH